MQYICKINDHLCAIVTFIIFNIICFYHTQCILYKPDRKEFTIELLKQQRLIKKLIFYYKKNENIFALNLKTLCFHVNCHVGNIIFYTTKFAHFLLVNIIIQFLSKIKILRTQLYTFTHIDVFRILLFSGHTNSLPLHHNTITLYLSLFFIYENDSTDRKSQYDQSIYMDSLQ